MSVFQVVMPKSYFDFTVTATILFTIILFLLLPALAYEDQQLAFANQTTITKNQINNNDNPANAYTNSTTPKVAILNFYDDEKGQIYKR